MNSRFFRIFLLSCLALLLLLLGFYIDQITLKSILFLVFIGFGSFLLFAPMAWAIYVLVLYLGVEGFAKLMTNYNPIIHVGSDILIVSLWIRTILTFIIHRRPLPQHYPPLTSLFLVHAIWFVICIANPSSLSLIASLAGAKLYLTIVSLYFFGYYLTTNIKSVKAFMIPWIIVSGIESVTSLYQASIGPSSVTSWSPAYGFALKKFTGYAFRPFGLTSQPGFPAIFIYISVPFLIYLLLYARSAITSIIMMILLPIALLALFICQIRSAIFRAILGGAGVFVYYLRGLGNLPRRTKLIAVPILVGILIIMMGSLTVLLNKFSAGNKDNQRAIERSLTLFDFSKVSHAREGALERFLAYAEIVPLGAGLSRIGAAAGKFQDLIQAEKFYAHDFFADNLWIELLVDLGLPGLLIFNAIIFAIIYKGLTSVKKIQNRELKVLQWTLLCTLTAILVGAYGAEPILYNPEGPFFWFFSGVLIKLPTLEDNLEI